MGIRRWWKKRFARRPLYTLFDSGINQWVVFETVFVAGLRGFKCIDYLMPDEITEDNLDFHMRETITDQENGAHSLIHLRKW